MDTVELGTGVAPQRLDVPTGTDGVVPFERVGRVELEGLGRLDVWRLASYGGGLFVPVKDRLAGTRTSLPRGRRPRRTATPSSPIPARLAGARSVGGACSSTTNCRSAVASAYGGGRYLLDTVKGADLGGDAAHNRLVIDLNFAYNPSCAYDPAWACPLAPPGNVLAADVDAGELYLR